jgi:hypothetical protein
MGKDLPPEFNETLFYQRMGEFVVSFQWIEDQFRQIGWRTIDPEMVKLPNEELRNESNNDLLNKILSLLNEFITKYKINITRGYQLDFAALVARFNNRFHSAYQELKAGGELWVGCGLILSLKRPCNNVAYP